MNSGTLAEKRLVGMQFLREQDVRLPVTTPLKWLRIKLIKLRIFSCKLKPCLHYKYIFTDKQGGGEASHAGFLGGPGQTPGRGEQREG